MGLSVHSNPWVNDGQGLMNRYAEGRLDDTLLALANPTRRAILARLAAGDACVTEIAEPFGMSLNAVSKHLKRLERAG